MSADIKNIFKVASIYATTVIGAGFASGQEIMQFFSSYYKGGFYGIVTAGLLFCIIGCIVLDKVYTERIKDYNELIFPMMGWYMGWIVQIFASLFMLSVFCVMIAGSGNILSDCLHIPFKYGVVIMSMICMFIILTNIRGIVIISTIVTPVLITGILVIGFYIIISKDASVFSINSCFEAITNNWFFSALIYVGYNSLLSLVIMSGLLPYLKSKSTGIAGGILGGLMLCFIALVLNTGIYMFYPEVMSHQFPIITIIEKFSMRVKSIYTFVLWLAMFVSAITSGYCLIESINSKIRVDKKIITAVVCAFAIPMSSVGFSQLIALVYPIFGYIGVFVVLVILLHGTKYIHMQICRYKYNK